MSVYIPPALRSKQQVEARRNPAGGNISLHNIHAYFWPSHQQQDQQNQGSFQENRTLHASEATPDKLAYVILFHQANPRWKHDHIIFTKSNLELLPAQLADSGPNDQGKSSSSTIDDTGHLSQEQNENTKEQGKFQKAENTVERPAVAVFSQVGQRQRGRSFEFAGWYKVDPIQILEPQSHELCIMLKQKWTRVDRSGNKHEPERDASSWLRSLRHQWAVVKFARDEEADRERGILQVTCTQKPETKHPKSVNELLAELRKVEKN